MKKTQTTQAALESRIEENRRLGSVHPALARKLLAEYLDKERPTSYRKLAAKYGKTANAVMRAIKRAATERDATG